MTKLLTMIALAGLLMFIACGTNQSPSDQMDDATITMEVKAKFASDLEASTLTNVEVNTTNRVVTLAGQVDSEDIKRRAEAIAETVDGVVRVNNNLQVRVDTSG